MALGLAAWSATGTPSRSQPARVSGWLNWRGPQGTGVSTETGLPTTLEPNGGNALWTVDLAGGGTPVIANGKLYALGYEGQGPDLQEVLRCMDAETGAKVWEHRFSDFLSDIVYDRYAIGSPAIDPATGNVFVLTSAGVFASFTPDGKQVWQHSLMEEIGRLTFTNGRTGSPLVDGDLVFIRSITSNWGGDGPAMDRFYAYDTKSGRLVWASAPGVPPKDYSFAQPALAWRDGKRVMYSGTGDGSVFCLNARTGQPIWRYPVSAGGFNSSVVLHKDKVIAIHADENLSGSGTGRQLAVKLDATPKPAPMGVGTPLLDESAEAWRNDLGAISSSPVLVGDRIYQMNKTGFLCAVDANTGQVVWRHRLGPDQLHASPLYADGKLYVPMHNGSFFIVKPNDTDATDLAKTQLAGACIGAPAVWNGKVYVFSTEKLYCFGNKSTGPKIPQIGQEPGIGFRREVGKPVALQVLPAEILLRPGQKAQFTIRGIDENGFPTGEYPSAQAKWEKYIPPTARVRSEMNATFTPQGEIVAAEAAEPSAGAFQVTIDGLKGTIRGRVLPDLPFKEDFEKYDISVDHATETGTKFAYPPLPWIGARFKWEVRDMDGAKVLAKTLDNVFFQRATVFFGHPDTKNYTLEADVRGDGNRRTMSTVGLVNQRYVILLSGNSQELEINSNHERVKVVVPFKWVPGEWYRLKTRVDVESDGSGVVRGKAWKRGEAEPEKWSIEAPLKRVHTHGAPGFFGFSPQSLFRVYIDNISVTPNK
jgi:outer membrane protein assembly factor BamB